MLKIVNMAELVYSLKNADFQTRDEIVALYQKRRLIIFDDIGSESRTDFTNDILFQILNRRYEYMLWTGFTSNFKLPKLPYEDRIISRIIGIVGKNKYAIEGKDRRT